MLDMIMMSERTLHYERPLQLVRIIPSHTGGKGDFSLLMLLRHGPSCAPVVA